MKSVTTVSEKMKTSWLWRPSDRLLWSAHYNQLDILRTLITERPDLVQTRDEDGYSLLHRVSYSGHVEVGWRIF